MRIYELVDGKNIDITEHYDVQPKVVRQPVDASNASSSTNNNPNSTISRVPTNRT